jgi:4-amino-4-deoxy-L-arabinose transferase-like glycosyltransferase
MIEVGTGAGNQPSAATSQARQLMVQVLSPSGSRWWPLWPALILATGAITAIGVTGFDGLYGQDAFAYFDYATRALRGSILHLQTPPPFYWPPGYPLFVASLSLIVGNVPLAGQIASLAGGAGVSGLTVLVAREAQLAVPAQQQRGDVAWRSVPLIAGLIAAATGQLLQSSVVVMSDTVALAAATAGAWSMLRYRRTGAARWLVLASVAFAWAIISRWIYGLVAVPFVAYSLLLLMRRRPRRLALWHASIAAASGLLILAPVIVPALRALIAGLNAPFAGQLRVYSWSPFNAFRSDFVTADGHLQYSIPNGLYYAFAPAEWWYFTPVLAVLVPLGLWAAVAGRGIGLGLLMGWAAVVLAFHAGAPWQNARFTLAYLPPLAIIAAIGFARLWARADPRLRTAAAAYLMIALVLSAIGSAFLTARFIERKGDDLATVRWVAGQAPEGSQLLTFGLTATFKHYSAIDTFDLSELNASSTERLISDGRPTLVLLDLGAVERQWTGRAPWENFRSLREGPGLLPLGVRGPYSLFRVLT